MMLCVNTQERGIKKFLRMRMGIVFLDRERDQLFHFMGVILHMPPGNYTHYEISYSCIVEYFGNCRAALASLVIFTSIFCAGSSFISVCILL